jgi:hypothetical protein
MPKTTESMPLSSLLIIDYSDSLAYDINVFRAINNASDPSEEYRLCVVNLFYRNFSSYSDRTNSCRALIFSELETS